MNNKKSITKKVAFCLIAFIVFFGIALCLAEWITKGAVQSGKLKDAPEFSISGTEFVNLLYDPLLGWRNKPGLKKSANVSNRRINIRINSLGFRSPPIKRIKPSGTIRIVVLGDSFTWGWGVDQDETYSMVLENILNQRKTSNSKFEVINTGVTGYSTDQEYLLLKNEGLNLNPDIVVLFVYFNDFLGNATAIHNETPKPVFVEKNEEVLLENVPVPYLVPGEGGKWIMRPRGELMRCTLYRVLATRGMTRDWSRKFLHNSRLAFLEKKERKGKANPVEIIITKYLLKQIHQTCNSNGIELLVVYCPELQSISGRDFENDQKQLEWFFKVGQESGFPIMDIRTKLKQNDLQNEQVCLPQNAHLNPLGHQVVADMLYEKIAALPVFTQ